MERISVELKHGHIEQLDRIQDDRNASSRSETVRQILEDCEERSEEPNRPSYLLEHCDEQLAQSEEEIERQSGIEKELKNISAQIREYRPPFEPKEKGIFRPFLGRIAAINFVAILGVFAFFARRGLINLYDLGPREFVPELINDLASPVEFLAYFYTSILTLIALLLLVIPIILVLFTLIPERIDNSVAPIVDRLR